MFSPPVSGVDMIIGSFRAVDEGYVGHIETLSFGRRAVVFVPLEDDKFSYDVLFVHADNDVTLKFGNARRHKEKAREYLKVRLDCPALPSPLEAIMSLKASREGTYLLVWERKDTRSKKRS